MKRVTLHAFDGIDARDPAGGRHLSSRGSHEGIWLITGGVYEGLDEAVVKRSTVEARAPPSRAMKPRSFPMHSTEN